MGTMDRDIARLVAIADELRRIREGFTPKRNDNPRYHALSAAIAQINRAISHLQSDC
ncbi:MAG TPA: hypothetical protein VHB69_08710 [Mycobacteriales bacterium]|nr:hypothetical protein [Mycobacteriales bacterium]